jgi:hypothetical protein
MTHHMPDKAFADDIWKSVDRITLVVSGVLIKFRNSYSLLPLSPLEISRRIIIKVVIIDTLAMGVWPAAFV